MKKPLGFALFIISCAIGLLSQSATPKLTDAQKLEIRTAQVHFFEAKTNLESTPQYQAFQSAQAKLQEVAQKVAKEAGADPGKFQLQPSLEFTPVPQPPQPPKPAAPEKK